MSCDQCGSFDLIETVAVTVRSLDRRAQLALRSAARQGDEFGRRLVLDPVSVLREISAHKDRSVKEKLHRVVALARHRSEHFGAQITLQPETDYLLVDAANPLEAWALVEQTQKDGLLTKNTVDQLYCGCLTREGWELAETVPRQLEHPRTGRATLPPLAMATTPFRVAFSFPGEARYRIGPVAAALAQRIGREGVFYDDWHKAELARPNLDLLLQSIYTGADLVVVCLCAAYEEKDWCGVEWRAVRDIIKQRKDRVMFLRLDEGEVSGAFSVDGYIDLRQHGDAETAELIEKRVGGRTWSRPTIPEPLPVRPHQTPVGAEGKAGQNTPAAEDIRIVIEEIQYGFAVRLRNDGCDPVNKCIVRKWQMSKYVEAPARNVKFCDR